jgi:hypothetical protein
VKVELLWWDGCPSHPQALDELRAVMSEEGLDPEALDVREIESDEQAERERFPGSPTIRIDGRDAVPPGEGDPIGLTCRVYRLRDGRPSPTPDPADLRDAIAASSRLGRMRADW